MGNRILISCFTFLLFFSTAQAQIVSLTPEQREFLEDLKIETFKTLQKTQNEAYLMRQCFVDDRLCDSSLLSKKAEIRSGILQRHEEYRLLVGLSIGSKNLRMLPYASLGIGFPKVFFTNEKERELQDIEKIEAKDLQSIRFKLENDDQKRLKQTDPQMLNSRIEVELNQSRIFYKHQAYLLVSQIPFISFISSSKPSDLEIAHALSVYLSRIEESVLELYDVETTKLESFMTYTPIVSKLIQEKPEREKIFLGIQFQQKALYGVQAWIEKNTPSLTMAGFATCSFVSAVLQAWPIALSCGGVATALTSHQLYLDYHTLQEYFTLWMAGVQSQSNYTDRQARVLYTTLTLLFIGQRVGSTILGIDASLASVLTQLPQTAATRFTSLTALRESSFDFAKGFVDFRSKDLGGSLIAQTHASNLKSPVKLKKFERLFSYSDLMLLEKGISQIKDKK